jgi:hypothetical protein
MISIAKHLNMMKSIIFLGSDVEWVMHIHICH